MYGAVLLNNVEDAWLAAALMPSADLWVCWESNPHGSDIDVLSQKQAYSITVLETHFHK